MKRFAIAAASALTLAGAAFPAVAFAADPAEARLAAPVSEPVKVIIDGRLWSCDGQKCTTGPQGRNQPIGRECIRAAKVLGPILAYRQGSRTLDEAGLAACNAESESARAVRGVDASTLIRSR